MDTKVFKAYLDDCRIFGWHPCFEGARAYNWLVKKGFKGRWIV